jgi:SAM-dependent methyltransferase
MNTSKQGPPSYSDADLARTAEYWNREHFSEAMQRSEWQSHPLSMERLGRLLGYSLREEWFVKSQLAGKRIERALGVGVGTAATELQILVRGGVEHYDFYDLSPAGLAAARSSAEKLGVGDRISCFCEDVTANTLADNSYDLITFIASLHHIDKLDEMLEACYRALRPGGILWAAEYIGPNRFAYPPQHTDLARKMFHLIDPRLKKSWEPELKFPTAQEVIDADPTEAVHSEDIVAAIKKHFRITTITPLYGSFAFIMFWGLNHDAVYELREGEELVKAILDIDSALIDANRLPHYFANIVARKETHRQVWASRIGINPAGRFYYLLHRVASHFRNAG